MKMRVRSTGLILSALLLAISAPARSAALLHELFQDHAVLQRDRPIVVWGYAAPNEVVTVSLAAATARAQADAAGRWNVTLPAMAAGGPFCAERPGQFGWPPERRAISCLAMYSLCSGQSNMEMPVLRAAETPPMKSVLPPLTRSGC